MWKSKYDIMDIELYCVQSPVEQMREGYTVHFINLRDNPVVWLFHNRTHLSEYNYHFWIWQPLSPSTVLMEEDNKGNETLPGAICNLCQRSDPLYYLQCSHHRSKIILVIMALLFWRPLSTGCCALAGNESMTLTIHASFIPFALLPPAARGRSETFYCNWGYT